MRVAVVGSTGYLGSRLVHALLADSDVEFVVGIGRRPASWVEPHPKLHYVQAVLPRVPLSSLFDAYQVSAMVHLVFSSRPTHGNVRAYQSNVAAAAAAFTAAAASHVSHAVLVSSVAVYGPRAGAEPAVENDKLLPNRFVFSMHKLLQEKAAVAATAGRSTALTVLRPCTVVGPAVHNFLTDMLRRPLVPIPCGAHPRWQFLHEDDFSNSTLHVLRARAAGVYNLVPDDAIPLREALRRWGSRALSVPAPVLTAVTGTGWFMRWPVVPAPPSALPFLCQGVVASNRLIKETLHVQFRYTSAQAADVLRRR